MLYLSVLLLPFKGEAVKCSALMLFQPCVPLQGPYKKGRALSNAHSPALLSWADPGGCCGDMWVQEQQGPPICLQEGSSPATLSLGSAAQRRGAKAWLLSGSTTLCILSICWFCYRCLWGFLCMYIFKCVHSFAHKCVCVYTWDHVSHQCAWAACSKGALGFGIHSSALQSNLRSVCTYRPWSPLPALQR